MLLLDEGDINLHSDILPHILRLFTDPDSNTGNAQLIFTRLSNATMNLPGSHGIYLFEKEQGESYCFRLDEPETNIIRDDGSIAESYRRHYLGGCPRIAS